VSAVDFEKLAKLLKACKASGVSDLKIGSIEIKFRLSDIKHKPKQVIEMDVPIPTAEMLKEVQESANIQANLESADDQMDFMQIEDPSLYERLIVERELEADGRRQAEI
jgi:hypothetical protein